MDLKSTREKKGYSEDDMAIICNVTIDNIKNYEKDARSMPFELAKKYKRLLHITIEQIYSMH